MVSRLHRARVLAVAAVGTASVMLWLVPGAAAACSISSGKLNGVQSFSGTASVSYSSGTVVWTPPVLPGGTQVTYTESIDRQASNIQLTDLTQTDQSGATFSNPKMPSGGTVTIADTYSDTLGGIATQGASGPTIAGGGGGGGAQIFFNTAACTYSLLIPYAIAAPTQANQPGIPADSGVYDQATTATMPIPSNLLLKGAATIPASGGGTSGGSGALYDMSGDPTWPDTLDSFAAQNNLSADPGTASVTWTLTPKMRPAKKSHKHKAKHHKHHKPKHHHKH
jgi:hypothetical protein